MSEISGNPRPAPPSPLPTRAAAPSGWKTLAQVALIVAAVLLVQRVLLPYLGLGT